MASSRSGWKVFTRISSYCCSIFGPTLFLLYINDLPDNVNCSIAIYADDTTLYSKCNQASDLWQQLELVSELESDLWDTVDWGKKWLVDFNAGKTQLVSFDWSNNNGSIDVKMDGSFCRVSILPGNPGNVLEFFFVLEFVLEFTIFRVLLWKWHGIFLLQFTIFLVIISVRVPSTLNNLENSLVSLILFDNLTLDFLCL